MKVCTSRSFPFPGSSAQISKGLHALRRKNGPNKLTHIVMDNSCVVPLIETEMEIGDGHFILGQNGV